MTPSLPEALLTAAEGAGKRRRLLEVTRVAGVGEAFMDSDGQRVRETTAERPELRVESAGDDNRGHGELSETVPKRHLGPRSARAQRRREPFGGVSEPIGAVVVAEGERGEQGLSGPPDEKLLDPVSEDLIGEGTVGGQPSGAFGAGVDPRRRGDEHQSADEFRTRQGKVEQDTTTQGVPDPPGRTAAEKRSRPVGDRCGGSIEVGGSFVGRGAVPGQVRCEDRLAQRPFDRAPRPSRLGEAVQRNEGCGVFRRTARRGDARR